MTLLLSGVVLWAVLHFIPIFARGFKQTLIERLGNGVYRGIFSLGVVLSIVLMVIGWRSGIQTDIYTPIAVLRPVGTILILVAFIFFGLAHAKTNLKRYIRNPQLTGMVMWAIGHLVVNGDNLSLALFGGLGLWALVSIPLINNREGKWVKPDKVPASAEIRPVITGLIIFAVFFVAHPYLFGVSPIPG